MGELMHDALGVGLAATQLGVLHRVLVYRAYAEDPLTALVNPVLEWASEELETRRRGLPQPAGRARRGRARRRACACARRTSTASRSRSRPRASTARVIQHEIDHLDGILILDRISREARKEAMRAMREAQRDGRAPPSGARRVLSIVFLGTTEFAAAILERLAGRAAHRPALVADPPRPPARARAAPGLAARRRARARARAARSSSPRASTTPRRVARIARRSRPAGGRRVRVRRADQGAAAVRARAAQRAPVAAAALARRGAGRARDHGRRRADGRLDHAPHGRPRQRARCASPSPSRSAPRTTTARSRARLQELGGELLLRALDATPPGAPVFVEQAEAGRDLCGEDRRRRIGCSTRRARRVELERVVRALHPHIGARAELPGGDAARRAARPRSAAPDAGGGETAPASSHATGACCCVCADGRARAARRAAAGRARDGRRRLPARSRLAGPRGRRAP